MNKPKLLIEQWLPIAEIGAECMRERGASSALPPLYFLHVWWARRPLTVSRAAILASLLPAYPDGSADIPPWPKQVQKLFPTFDSYKQWFRKLIGIRGDPVAARKLIDWANTNNQKLAGNPYGYARAFTVNPTGEDLAIMRQLLAATWGDSRLDFCDPMSGGGSIPFEALRYGLTVHANELNPVASVVLRATLDYPARFGPQLVTDLAPYGRAWCDKVRQRLETFYPLADQQDSIFAYVWARTVTCPTTGKLVPLSPTWWLRKGGTPIAVKVKCSPKTNRCTFDIVRGRDACARAKPDDGSVKRGTAISPWTGEAISGEYIKTEAQAGRMGDQLYAVGVKRARELDWRPPSPEDEAAYERAVKKCKDNMAKWEAQGLLPTEPRREGRADWACEIYGVKRWCDTYAPRQLLAMITMVEAAKEVAEQAKKAVADGKMTRQEYEALRVVLAFCVDKAADYGSRQTRWEATRNKIANSFARHDLSMRWSFGEFDASRNLAPWVLDQVLDAEKSMGQLAYHPDLFSEDDTPPVERLRFTTGPAQSLTDINDRSLKLICVDPPYYDNVNYAECSNYFYVWQKRTLGDVFPELFTTELANADDEAVMNPARFLDMGKKKNELAIADYENKMMACFKEMHRVLAEDGALTVMFTHKQVEAWDTLGMALLRAGFKIDASWPVHTESEASLHQAKKNAAASTILLVCRKRDKSGEPMWWDDLKKSVRDTARTKAKEFEDLGMVGVDLYISTFGPVLSVISENWPVLTSESDPKTGDPLPLKPGDALDLARQEVINLRKQGLLLGRAVEFDPITDWYVMAWDAFKAQEFPAGEALKLAIALGLDLERDLVRTKRLVTKKSASVVITLPAERRKKGMVDEDAESFTHLIDALHTAMMIYDEEGSKACAVFMDRQGLRKDGRITALVQALMTAIPTTRDKKAQFLRPEMTTLEAMRLLFWPDLPAPKEEAPPKLLDQQMVLDGMKEAEEEEDDEEGEE
jgi:adenine-specific DNA methylase